MHGGGLDNAGTLTLTNSTVADNRSVAAGAGGIENHAVSAGVTGTVTLRNTILARNIPGEAPDCVGPVTSLGHNVIGDLTGCLITPLSTDLTGDPGLGEYIDDGTPGRGHFPRSPLVTRPARLISFQ